MKAATIRRYGPPNVVRVVETPPPRLRAGELLLRVHAAAVTAADSRIRGARFPRGFALFARLAFGVFRPRRRILGSACSGVVEAVPDGGDAIGGFAVGDEVCGMVGTRMGAHAEYVAMPAARAVRKPTETSHEDAAGMLFGGTTALHFLRDEGAVSEGDAVLVNGASGAVGTNAVQLAKHFGAVVTAVSGAGNHALLRRLGADHVVDYRATPVESLTERYDVVLDAVGGLSPRAGRRLLKRDGVLLLVSADLRHMLAARGAVKAGAAAERTEDVEQLLRLMVDGRLAAVVDRVLGLEEIAVAHERVDTGHKVGNVLIRP